MSKLGKFKNTCLHSFLLNRIPEESLSGYFMENFRAVIALKKQLKGQVFSYFFLLFLSDFCFNLFGTGVISA